MSDNDDIKEQDNKIPRGWALFYIAGIVFVIYYVAAFTPELSGWSFNKRFDAANSAEKARAAASVRAGNPYANDKAAIEEAEGQFKTMCAGCHGEHLKNPAIGPDILKVPALTDDRIYDFINKGSANGMPAFGAQIGGDRVWKMVAYIQHERKEAGAPMEVAANAAPAANDTAAIEAGEAQYEKTCAGCHGLKLKNPPVGVDLLGTLTYGEAAADLTESITKGRPNGMPTFGGQIGAEGIRNVVAYIQHERQH